jgi:hypothetical protein
METTATDHMVFMLVDDLAYLSSPDGFGSIRGLHILDVSDPAQQRQVLFTEQWGGLGLAADGNLVLV